MFSIPFIEKKDISPKEKSYIISSQQFMYKDVEGLGKISFSDKELSTKINLSEARIAKYDQSLVEKGYLSLIKSSKKDSETGLFINNKFFKLSELEQKFVCAIQGLEEKTNKTDNVVNLVLKENEKIKKENLEMQRKYDQVLQLLKNRGIIDDNEIINSTEFIM